MSRCISLAVLIAALSGCGDFEEAFNAEPRQNSSSIAGIASTSDIEDVQSATSGVAPSSAQPTTPPPGQPTPAPTPAPTPQPGTPQKTRPPATPQAAAQPSTPQAPKRTFIGLTTAEVIDYKQYRNNPFIVVVDNRVQGKDPLTVAASAYVSATSRASVANFKNQLNIIKAMNGKAPTFKEYKDLSKRLRIEFARLPKYQAYAYDETTGGLFIVENKKYKIEVYRQAGVPIEPGDKKYEQLLKKSSSKQQ